jgi:hypothetical protein
MHIPVINNIVNLTLLNVNMNYYQAKDKLKKNQEYRAANPDGDEPEAARMTDKQKAHADKVAKEWQAEQNAKEIEREKMAKEHEVREGNH